jgi:hypothetical protein
MACCLRMYQMALRSVLRNPSGHGQRVELFPWGVGLAAVSWWPRTQPWVSSRITNAEWFTSDVSHAVSKWRALCYHLPEVCHFAQLTASICLCAYSPSTLRVRVLFCVTLPQPANPKKVVSFDCPQATPARPYDNIYIKLRMTIQALIKYVDKGKASTGRVVCVFNPLTPNNL